MGPAIGPPQRGPGGLPGARREHRGRARPRRGRPVEQRQGVERGFDSRRVQRQGAPEPGAVLLEGARLGPRGTPVPVERYRPLGDGPPRADRTGRRPGSTTARPTRRPTKRSTGTTRRRSSATSSHWLGPSRGRASTSPGSATTRPSSTGRASATRCSIPVGPCIGKRVFYSTYDVTSQLRQGRNCLGVDAGQRLVQPAAAAHVGAPESARAPGRSGRPRFIAQLEVELADGSRQTIVSDPTWRVDRRPARSSTSTTSARCTTRASRSTVGTSPASTMAAGAARRWRANRSARSALSRSRRYA